MNDHNGEIILREKYGSSSREIKYVKFKSADHKPIAIVDYKRGNVVGLFTKIFLPQGYPESVSGDYLAYQFWDTAQAFCSTITGTLATQEVLKGVGVGNTEATPLAATITWVVKDSCGHIGRILFAFSHGTYLDAYSKTWRLYADSLNDAAMCVEIALPLFNKWTTFFLCLSTVMKAIVGVAGGATRAAMTQHHAVRGNLADVAAKDSAQETAVNLVASMAALLIITWIGNSLTIFFLLMVLHIVFNYMAVRAVCLRTLNEPRLLRVIEVYLKQEAIATPCEINANEPIVFYQLGSSLLDLKLCGFQIKMGCSLMNFIRQSSDIEELEQIKRVYYNRQYLLLPRTNTRGMYVLVKDRATTDHLLCAYFHAVLLSAVFCAINDVNSSIYNSKSDRPFSQVCRILQGAEFIKEPIVDAPGNSAFKYKPSRDLLIYIDRIVHKEWLRISQGLIKTGWDLSKHLLVVDEWRVTYKSITKED